MQQQAALMAAAQGSGTTTYLANPTIGGIGATQMHINPLALPNGLTTAAITPTTTGEGSPVGMSANGYTRGALCLKLDM